jgi:hypothetical protein
VIKGIVKAVGLLVKVVLVVVAAVLILAYFGIVRTDDAAQVEQEWEWGRYE